MRLWSWMIRVASTSGNSSRCCLRRSSCAARSCKSAPSATGFILDSASLLSLNLATTLLVCLPGGVGVGEDLVFLVLTVKMLSMPATNFNFPGLRKWCLGKQPVSHRTEFPFQFDNRAARALIITTVKRISLNPRQESLCLNDERFPVQSGPEYSRISL